MRYALCLTLGSTGVGASGCSHSSASHLTSRSPASVTRAEIDLRLPPGVQEHTHASVQSIWPVVEQSAREFDVDPRLILAVIWVESRFEIYAQSGAGAKGLMQIMPSTAKGLAKQLDIRTKSLYDPTYNVRLGSYYLRWLLDRFDGRQDLALAAYNAGPGRVRSWMRAEHGLPEYSRKYVLAVRQAQNYFQIDTLSNTSRLAVAHTHTNPIESNRSNRK